MKGKIDITIFSDKRFSKKNNKKINSIKKIAIAAFSADKNTVTVVMKDIKKK